jgi:hypothetical protein
MDSIERARARTEAGKDIAAKPSREGRHEDELLRHLGAVYYELRQGRGSPEKLERAVAEVATHVREPGSVAGKRRRTRRPWWSLWARSRGRRS